MERQCGMLIDRGKPKVLGEKHVPEVLCSPQNPHDPHRDWVTAWAVRSL